jgi:hypothetical protein
MALQWLPGASIGLLVGLLVGLSTSDVVGSVIAGLVALLAAFFGLGGGSAVPKSGTEPGISPRDQRARIASFGLFCAFAVLLGVYIRTHNLFGPTPAELAKAWKAAGYSEEDSRKIAAYQHAGLLPKGFSAVDKQNITRTTMLFGAVAPECEPLSKVYNPRPSERLKVFKEKGGVWESVATAIDGLSEDRQSRIMEAVWQAVCTKEK